MPPVTPEFVVRFPDQDDHTVGVGFVVDPDHVLTCAHVINEVLGRPKTVQAPPDQQVRVTLRLPLRDNAIRQAKVVCWRPPPPSGIAAEDGEDIAGLESVGEKLPDVAPAELADPSQMGAAVHVFGYPKGVNRPGGVWIPATLRSQTGGGLLQLDSGVDALWRVQAGFSGTPVIDTATGAVVGMFKGASPRDDARDGYATPTVTLRRAWEDVLGVVPPSPYRPLKPFRKEDHEVFLGRDADTAELLAAVARSPLVVVTGPSGVGKSSLVRAGLIPKLEADGWMTAVDIRPRWQPFQELASELARADAGTASVETLRARVRELRSGGLAKLLGELRALHGRQILVIIDSLEKLFAPDSDPTQTAPFLEMLLSLPDQLDRQGKTGGAAVVTTLRADFYDHLLNHPDAARRLRGREVTLSPLGRAALREVICSPAKHHNVQFEAGLVERILDDATDQVGALPLLQFVVDGLWQRQRGRHLRHTSYNELGRLPGALSARADQEIDKVIDKLRHDGVEKEIAEKEIVAPALLSLINRPETDRPATRRTCRPAQLSQQQREVIDALTKARLIVADRDEQGPRAELAHDILLRTWPRLADLAEEEAAFTRWRTEVERWQQNWPGRSLPEEMLAEAWRWCNEPHKDTSHLHELVTSSERERHRRIAELEEAKARAEANARRAEALRLADRANVLRLEGAVPTDALAKGIESLRTEPTLEGDLAVRRILKTAGRPLHRLSHDGALNTVVFSPDGARVATASADDTAALWDAATGQRLRQLQHDGEVYTVVFSPDGARVATASADHTAALWDATTGQRLRQLQHDGDVRAIVFSPDGTRVATASDSSTTGFWTARVWGVDTETVLSLYRHDDKIRAITFSPEGVSLATASGRAVYVWDTEEPTSVVVLEGHRGWVNGVAFTPDGNYIVTASADHTARLWTADGQVVRVFPHNSWVTAIAVAGEAGTRMASASRDHTVCIWDTSNGQLLRPLKHADWVSAVTFSADVSRVASCGRERIARIWDVNTGDEIARLTHGGGINAVTFSPDNTKVASAGRDHTARIWEAAAGAEIARSADGLRVHAVSFSGGEPRLATTEQGHSVTVRSFWGEALDRLDHDTRVARVVLSRNGGVLATTASDHLTRIWPVTDTSTLPRYISIDHPGPVNVIALSHDGTRIVTAGQDGPVRVWDTRTGLHLTEFRHGGRGAWITAVAFSSDRRFVATASDDGLIRVWDSSVHPVPDPLCISRRPAMAIAFSPDGKLLGTTHRDHSAMMWNITAGAESAEVHRVVEHDDGTVHSIAFSPDGTAVATAGGDHSARIWDIPGGTERVRLVHDVWVQAVVFSPDGRQLITIDGDGVARLWAADAELLIDQCEKRLVLP